MTTPVSLMDDQMVDMTFITQLTGLTDKWFYKLIKDGAFPAPIKLRPAGGTLLPVIPREEYENETTVSDPLRAAPRKLPEMADRLHPARRILGRVSSEYPLLPESDARVGVIQW